MAKMNKRNARSKRRSSTVREHVQHAAGQAKDWVDKTLDEHPLAVGATFFTVGLVSGFAIPATGPEDRLMGRGRDRLMDRAEKAGTKLINKGERAAQRAVGTVKRTVGGGQKVS